MTDDRFVAKTNQQPYGLTVVNALGVKIQTEEYGWMYDLTSGIGVNNLGHLDSEVTRAVEKQMYIHSHVMVYGEMVTEAQSLYAAELAVDMSRFVKHDTGEELRVWFTTSGTEANEVAMKLAHLSGKTDRRSGGFIGVEGGFHGRTLGSLGVTYRTKYRKPFSDLLATNYAEWVREGSDPSTWPAYLRKRDALILELVRGEDGVHVVDRHWVGQVQTWCRKHGVLFIVDEVQTGFGRTGWNFGCEMYRDIKPDIITLGKAMGAGLPLGGVVARESLFDLLSKEYPFSHLSTFGGNPVSCAAGLAGYRALKKRDLASKSFMLGQLFQTRLLEQIYETSKMCKIRGTGLMLGLQLPTKGVAEKFVPACWGNGLWVGFVLHDEKTVRLYPPLTVTSEDIEEIVSRLVQSLNEVL